MLEVGASALASELAAAAPLWSAQRRGTKKEASPRGNAPS